MHVRLCGLGRPCRPAERTRRQLYLRVLRADRGFRAAAHLFGCLGAADAHARGPGGRDRAGGDQAHRRLCRPRRGYAERGLEILTGCKTQREKHGSAV